MTTDLLMQNSLALSEMWQKKLAYLRARSPERGGAMLLNQESVADFERKALKMGRVLIHIAPTRDMSRRARNDLQRVLMQNDDSHTFTHHRVQVGTSTARFCVAEIHDLQGRSAPVVVLAHAHLFDAPVGLEALNMARPSKDHAALIVLA